MQRKTAMQQYEEKYGTTDITVDPLYLHQLILLERIEEQNKQDQAELVRLKTEITRQKAEIARQKAEIARQQAEISRVQAERSNQKTSSGWGSQWPQWFSRSSSSTTTAKDQASKFTKR